jgi:hypothetical protein
MANPRKIKAIAGNSASCLGFSIALPVGSIPAASTSPSRLYTSSPVTHDGRKPVSQARSNRA